uniref:Uncharacterized protein n=1 Tax=Romanomermis culicivorax TaxID=13658 RepID=A0A915HJW0_ROMCU
MPEPWSPLMEPKALEWCWTNSNFSFHIGSIARAQIRRPPIFRLPTLHTLVVTLPLAGALLLLIIASRILHLDAISTYSSRVVAANSGQPTACNCELATRDAN